MASLKPALRAALVLFWPARRFWTYRCSRSVNPRRFSDRIRTSYVGNRKGLFEKHSLHIKRAKPFKYIRKSLREPETDWRRGDPARLILKRCPTVRQADGIAEGLLQFLHSFLSPVFCRGFFERKRATRLGGLLHWAEIMIEPVQGFLHHRKEWRRVSCVIEDVLLVFRESA